MITYYLLITTKIEATMSIFPYIALLKTIIVKLIQKRFFTRNKQTKYFQILII